MVLSGGQLWSPVVWLMYFGGVSSALLIGPLILTWLGPSPTMPANARALEYLVIGGGLALAAVLTHRAVPLYFLTILPLLVWAALRTGPRGAALMSFAILLLHAWAAYDLGSEGIPGQQRLLLGGLSVTQGVTSLLLAASVVERRRANRGERDTEAAYRALIGAAPFAVVGLDREGRVTAWSASAERMSAS